MAADEVKSGSEAGETIIFQLGTNNWQVANEPAPGSGILHKAHHNAYNSMENVYSYSVWPSGKGVQTTEKYCALYDKSDKLHDKTRIYALDGDIPICEANGPVSKRRWHAMTAEERAKYYNDLVDICYDFMVDIETKMHPKSKISYVIVHHSFMNPVIMNGVLKRREEKGLHVPPVGVFIHGTGVKMFENELNEVKDKVEEKDREFLLNDYPLAGVCKDKCATFFDWFEKDMKMFYCDSKFKPMVGYAISRESLASFKKVFTNFPKERLILSPNGIDTSVTKMDPTLKIPDVLKGLITYKMTKDTKQIEIPGKAPSGKDWSHLIIHVSRMADWKRPDSVLRAFAELLKDYPDAIMLMVGQGTPEIMVDLDGLANGELKLDKNCFFLGQRMLVDLARFYSVASVGLFPSKDEPFGMVFIECMICGTPVIGANSGGPKDFMIKDENNKDDCMYTTGAMVEESDDNKVIAQRVAKYMKESLKNDWKKTMQKECLAFKDRFAVSAQCENLVKDTWKMINSTNKL